jgi:hypothetical protein
VVRLFGYCLEPPNVCLVLELLPSSLKGIIYKQPSSTAGSISTVLTGSQSALQKNPTEDAEPDATMHLAVKGSLSSHSTTSQSAAFSSTGTSSHGVSTSQHQTPLSKLVASQLSMLTVLQISIDIAAGLKYLHDMPVVVSAERQGNTISISSASLRPVVEAGSTDVEAGDGYQHPSSMKTTKVVHRG